MLLIGICGASGSGKSTLAEKIVKEVDRKVLLISQDSYYIDHSELPFSEREKINYDEPYAFEHDTLLEDVAALKRGESIPHRMYDYAEHRRADKDDFIEPADVVIIEGIHALFDERLRNMYDLSIYMRVDPDICLLRRISRDIVERKRTIDSISTQYLRNVKPMFEQYIKAYEQYADVIIPHGGKNQTAFDMLCAFINSRT